MPSITQLCRDLRQKQTPAERKLWALLRDRQLHGQKFLRQHPIYIRSTSGKCEFYIPDFYCDNMKLVIEADGPVHLYKKEYDKNRDKVLASLGLKILRFTNAEIENDIETVLKRISECLV